jgi:hypothetical protein
VLCKPLEAHHHEWAEEILAGCVSNVADDKNKPNDDGIKESGQDDKDDADMEEEECKDPDEKKKK